MLLEQHSIPYKNCCVGKDAKGEKGHPDTQMLSTVGDIHGLDGSSHSAHDLIFCLNKISEMLIGCKNYQISETRWKNWFRYRHKTLKSFGSRCFPHSPINCRDTGYHRLQTSCPAWREMPSSGSWWSVSAHWVIVHQVVPCE